MMVDLKRDDVAEEIDRKKIEIKGGQILACDIKLICTVHPDQDLGAYGVLRP